MMINFVQFRGGFVGESRSEKQIHVKDLHIDVAKKIENLIHEADFFNLPEQKTAGVGCGGVRYEITINDDNKSHQYQCYGNSIPEKLVALVDFLKGHKNG